MGESCPQVQQHTPAPARYLGWHSWAQAMTTNGWRQRRCAGCGLWAIWVGTKPLIPPDSYQHGCIAVQFGKRAARQAAPADDMSPVA